MIVQEEVRKLLISVQPQPDSIADIGHEEVQQSLPVPEELLPHHEAMS